VNVRFSDGAIRCRVTRSELEQLLGTGSLQLVVAMPRRHHLQVTVRSLAVGSWEIDSDPTGIWISIPRDQLELLVQSLPRREGITHNVIIDATQQLQLSFEVDVRKRQRSAAVEVDPAGAQRELLR
jgi:hypothetical protein